MGRESICGAVLVPIHIIMPLLELACSAKAPNLEAQHATTLCGNVLEPCAGKCCCVRPVTKALLLLNLGSAETHRRIPHTNAKNTLLMSRGCMPAARDLTDSALK